MVVLEHLAIDRFTPCRFKVNRIDPCVVLPFAVAFVVNRIDPLAVALVVNHIDPLAVAFRMDFVGLHKVVASRLVILHKAWAKHHKRLQPWEPEHLPSNFEHNLYS